RSDRFNGRETSTRTTSLRIRIHRGATRPQAIRRIRIRRVLETTDKRTSPSVSNISTKFKSNAQPREWLFRRSTFGLPLAIRSEERRNLLADHRIIRGLIDIDLRPLRL